MPIAVTGSSAKLFQELKLKNQTVMIKDATLQDGKQSSSVAFSGHEHHD